MRLSNLLKIKNFFIISLIVLVGLTVGTFVSQSIFQKEGALNFARLKADISQIFQKKEIKKEIKVDISQQKLTMFENGKKVGELSISSGREETPTPVGEFKILNKSLIIYSRISGCWLHFWLGFTQDGDYGFHEVPICRRGQDLVVIEERIGFPASLGCIRLKLGQAQILYQWAEIGTKVTIYGEIPEWCHNFERPLKFGDYQQEVKFLKIALDKEGLVGEEIYFTPYFGPLTKKAVILFQRRYKDEISEIVGYEIEGTGYVGKGTLWKLNEIYGCR